MSLKRKDLAKRVVRGEAGWEAARSQTTIAWLSYKVNKIIIRLIRMKSCGKQLKAQRLESTDLQNVKEEHSPRKVDGN